MNPNQEHINPDLLIAYLCGEADPQQETEIRQWIEASEENKAEYETMQKIWQESGTAFPPPYESDTDAAWDNVLRKINDNEDKRGNKTVLAKKPSWLGWPLKIAAVVLPLIALGIYLFLSNRQTLQLSLDSKNTLINGTLPDGSQVNLNKNSSIRYPEKFDTDQREIILTGEAFLKVIPDPAKPFIVHTNTLDVVVLGTGFNVRSYPDNDITEVYVQSGRVVVYALSKENTRLDSVFLDPGYKGIYHRSSQKFECLKLTNENDLYWVSRKLDFRGTELTQVFEVLSANFGVKIIPLDNSISELRLTSSFHNLPVDRIMDIIGETLELKVNKVGVTYEVGYQHK